MINMKQMPLGAYQTNCYLVWGEDSPTCVVIDPGYEPERVLSEVARLNKTIEAVLLTHGHFDHVGAVKEIHAATGCKVYLHTADLVLPEKLTAGPLFYTHSYGEGDTLNLAGLTIDVIHTPGHTPGSVCLLMGNEMFSGDTLFACSFGRTDLPGGDPRKMMESLRRLASLQGNFFIHPGHGGSTTLDAEKRFNPYMH